MVSHGMIECIKVPIDNNNFSAYISIIQ